MKREAEKVRQELQRRAQTLFDRAPLGWDLETLRHLSGSVLVLPLKIPAFTKHVAEQARVLGVVGSALVLLLAAAALYALVGQTRVLERIDRSIRPLEKRLPRGFYPYLLALINVVVSALIPLLLLGLFGLVRRMIDYRAAWFLLVGRLLGLWAVGALVLRSLKEILTGGLFQAAAGYGGRMFRYGRLVVLYILAGIALNWAAEALDLRPDLLAFFRFAVSCSIVTVVSLFFLKKRAFLSLFPELEYRSYQWLVRFLRKYYYPLLAVSFLAGLLWCVGYRPLGKAILTKIWYTLGAFLLIILLYQVVDNRIKVWWRRQDPSDEAARGLEASLKTLLLYTTLLATAGVILNLLGLLGPLSRLMSFPMFRLGANPVTPWIGVKALLILLTFIFATKLFQAYMDYRVYPKLGIDPGLAYALNTTFRYTALAVGVIVALKVVGFDLRVFLVFAGAAGIGIGLGLQNMAANIISGFSIIFGGKIRKGDWIEVGQTLGTVTDIYLRATKVRTRDNIEYLIPNSDLISKTIVNYSLSSPLIRIELPVGVSYDADPEKVKEILLQAARSEPLVSRQRDPSVRFIGYGESSIDFDLLIWIDVRRIARRKVRSALYFTIFKAFREAGIEIPYPQRDIHIRSRAESTTIG